ncbi:unnamed protein product, partial [Auanema sp. JU1783]
YGGTHDSDREKVFWGNEFILGILRSSYEQYDRAQI